MPARAGRRGASSYECARCRFVFGPDTEASEDDDWRDDPEESAFELADDPPPIASRRRRAASPSPPPEMDEPPPEAPALRREFDVDDAEEEDEEDDRPPARHPRAAATPSPRRRRPREEEEDEEEEATGVARFALRALIGVTLLYAVASVWASTHPDRFQGALAHVPVIGARLAETPIDPGDVALREVRGQYEYAKSGELAFVIRATAVNLASVPLRRVRVEGSILGASDRHGLATCSDAPADVRNLPRHMLELMQDVRETRPITVAVGASTQCQVVFFDPPRPLRELSLEVVAVSGD